MSTYTTLLISSTAVRRQYPITDQPQAWRWLGRKPRCQTRFGAGEGRRQECSSDGGGQGSTYTLTLSVISDGFREPGDSKDGSIQPLGAWVDERGRHTIEVRDGPAGVASRAWR